MKIIIAILPTVLLVVIGQIITKWRISYLSELYTYPSPSFHHKIVYYLLDPYVFFAYLCSFIASASWFFVIEKYQVSTAFPIYIGSTLLLVLLCGAIVLKEPLTFNKILSVMLIVLGVYIGSK